MHILLIEVRRREERTEQRIDSEAHLRGTIAQQIQAECADLVYPAEPVEIAKPEGEIVVRDLG
ncbi:MAG: hypothetical protein WDO68_01750 [Gammaproteobacteria bacterium]